MAIATGPIESSTEKIIEPDETAFLHTNSGHAIDDIELQMLNEVATAISSSFELDRILRIILTAATAAQGLGFNRVFLFMHDQRKKSLIGRMAVGPADAEEAGRIWDRLAHTHQSLEEMYDAPSSPNGRPGDHLAARIQDYRFQLGDHTLVDHVCRSARGLNLEEVEDIDERTRQLLEYLGTTRAALVPLVAKGRLMGLLVADNLITGGRISDRAVQHLQMLASQAAVAMEKAWLYDEQKQRAQELERANVRLAETHEQILQIEKMSVIGELTSSIAHELRNPLTIIGGFANLMLKGSLTDDIRQYLEIIASETKRTEEVLDHVLDFRKASSGERVVLEFSSLVEQNLAVVASRLNQAGCDYLFSRANDKLLIYGNRDQLAHALFQFLKLIFDEVIAPAKLRVRTEARDDMAIVRIGIEVAEEHRGRLTSVLKKICSEKEASQRLTILVAGETLRYHGGGYGLSENEDGLVSLEVELPLYREK